MNRHTERDIYNDLNIDIEYPKFKKIITCFAEKLSEGIVKGKSFKLPKRLGILEIRKRVTKFGKSIDFHLTKKYGETIYHTNKHSDGYYALVHWDKSRPQGSFTNKMLWKFTPTRTNKRTIAKSIKENNTINLYLEL